MIPEGFDSFSLGRFRFHFRVTEDLTLPRYKGAVLRGAFGKSMRNMSCLPDWDRPCSSCLLKGDCAYSYLFETPNTRHGDILDGVSHAPHPFIFRPPLSTQEAYRAGEPFELEIVLIGRAVRLLPRVIYALERFGMTGTEKERPRMALESIEALTGSAFATIYTAGADCLNEVPWELTAGSVMGDADIKSRQRVDMHVLTPLRMKSHGSLTDSMNLTMLTKNLLRRIYLLDRWHCGGKTNFDHKALIRLSEEVTTERENLSWTDWTRYSFRQKADLKMGGLVGRISFSGPMGELMPYLRLGELIHIGKGTAFGMGMYSLTSGPV